MRWPFARKQNAPPAPRHVEIWGHLEENNRFLRRLAAASVAWAFLALAVAAYAILVALYRPLAFHVDPDGQATFLGRVREHATPTEPEVRYVAKQFLRRYIAFNSLTIEHDLAQAWNLMTDELRADQDAMLASYERDQGKEFVAHVKDQEIQTVLEFRDDRLEVTDHNGSAFSVRLLGSARTWPLHRVGEDGAFTEREFESHVTLVRCARTELTPNGLLVAKVVNRFFVPGTGDHATEEP